MEIIINIKIKTDETNHLYVYIEDFAIFISAMGTAEIINNKVNWFKKDEKDRLIVFLKNFYPKELELIKKYI